MLLTVSLPARTWPFVISTTLSKAAAHVSTNRTSDGRGKSVGSPPPVMTARSAPCSWAHFSHKSIFCQSGFAGACSLETEALKKQNGHLAWQARAIGRNEIARGRILGKGVKWSLNKR